MILPSPCLSVCPQHESLCVQVRDGGLCCRLHESTFPLSPSLVEELESELKPFCAVAGLRFEECDERSGPWRNYYVGIVGDVDSEEHEVLWPNQARPSLCHKTPPSLQKELFSSRCKCFF